MKCYVLEDGAWFVADKTAKAEVSAEVEKEILALCGSWQARDLHQEGRDTDNYESSKRYEALDAESFVVRDGCVLGYYATHFTCASYVPFPIKEKYHVEDYDNTDYSNSGRVDRGHVCIVPKPDTDGNPYSDETRFHSQAEYDDHIKWMN